VYTVLDCKRLSLFLFLFLIFLSYFWYFYNTCSCKFSHNFQDMWQATVKAISNDILKNLMIGILETVYFESAEDRVMSAVNRMVT